MFKVYHFNKVGSTNEKAKEFNFGSVIIADSQTLGKGRFKRRWSSSSGGIYMSIVLEPVSKPQFYTFIAAISVFKAIKDVLGVKMTIKWPNDLIFEGKKVCGILTKSLGDKVIVGIGVNTNNTVPESLKAKGISLKKIINGKIQIKKEINKKIKIIDNKKLINKILNHFEKYIKLLKNKKYSKIISDWKKDSFLGSEVRVKSLGKEYYGVAFDVDKDCFLIVKGKNKRIRVMEGDVFILGRS